MLEKSREGRDGSAADDDDNDEQDDVTASDLRKVLRGLLHCDLDLLAGFSGVLNTKASLTL